jgi:replicative DNA helicase
VTDLSNQPVEQYAEGGIASSSLQEVSMKLSAPVYRLKRHARLLSREHNIPLHAALDKVAVREGYANWSLLAAKLARTAPAAKLFPHLMAGDMVLLAARPGQGKTLLSLEIALEAIRAGGKVFFFTLEYNERDVLDRLRAVGADCEKLQGKFLFDGSDAISADYIVQAVASQPRGTLVIVDFMQLLDQRRDKPALAVQIRRSRALAEEKGLILIFLSQVDRSYDPSRKACPQVEDVRLPNPLDLKQFNVLCFLHNGEIQFRRGPS